MGMLLGLGMLMGWPRTQSIAIEKGMGRDPGLVKL